MCSDFSLIFIFGLFANREKLSPFTKNFRITFGLFANREKFSPSKAFFYLFYSYNLQEEIIRKTIVEDKN